MSSRARSWRSCCGSKRRCALASGRGSRRSAEKYEKFLRDDHVATAADAPALIAAYSDLAKALVDGKRAQVEALNQVGLSLAEYRWIRTQAYGAAQDPAPGLRAADRGRAERPGTDAGEHGPAPAAGLGGTQAQVAPHRQALERYAALAYFGL